VNQNRAFTDRSYATFLSEEQLMGSRCGDCDALFVPPRALCPACHGQDFSWEQASGRGRLLAMTRMAMVSPELAAEGFGNDRPYLIGVVQLDEGPRVVARLEETGPGDAGTVEVGAAMEVGFELFDHRTPRLVFRPA
jgi:uncharacterized OB-fold protein